MNSLQPVSFLGGLALGLALGSAITKFVVDKCSNDDDSEWEDDDTDEEEEDEQELVVTNAGGYVDEPKGNVKMVLVVRNDLKMGKGKAAAQCSHATLAAYKSARSHAPKTLRRWESRGQPKITTKVEDEEALLTAMAVARSLGLVAECIQDAGRTQIAPGSKTVVAVGPGPEHLVDQVTGQFKLF